MAASWTPRSQRTGRRSYEGPFEGIPDHLRPQLLQWLHDTLRSSAEPSDFAEALALRLHQPLDMRDDAVVQLVSMARSDDDLCWDLVEGAVRAPFEHYSTANQATTKLRTILNLSGSAYTLSDELLVLERVGEQAQAVYDAVTAVQDHTSDELREAWAKAYGRNPDPSDAWDHAIKAVETVLQPVVEPKNTKATLGSIIAALAGGGGAKFKSAFAGPTKDNSVDTLVGALRLLWPNPDRHGAGGPPRVPTLQEARAVVNLAAALVQCERDDYLVALR